MKNTVKLSLSRFKELEYKEDILNELKEKRLIYFERKSFLIHDIEKIYEVYGLHK